MISAIGVRNLVENQVDLSKSRNVIVVSLIISLALGITFSGAGAITFSLGSITLRFSGLAVAAVVGIVVNAILPGKDYSFQNDYSNGKLEKKKA
ncbi:MAG: uracil-xanthine permease, partial [Candidatus Ventricola sp.]